jgi:hypothetical protein
MRQEAYGTQRCRNGGDPRRGVIRSSKFIFFGLPSIDFYTQRSFANDFYARGCVYTLAYGIWRRDSDREYSRTHPLRESRELQPRAQGVYMSLHGAT